jgi:hypothetical protein
LHGAPHDILDQGGGNSSRPRGHWPRTKKMMMMAMTPMTEAMMLIVITLSDASRRVATHEKQCSLPLFAE